MTCRLKAAIGRIIAPRPDSNANGNWNNLESNAVRLSRIPGYPWTSLEFDMAPLETAVAWTAAALIPFVALATTIGGTYYATQYDYPQFFTPADSKPWRAMRAGSPFAETTTASTAVPLPVAARVVLVFNAAPDTGAAAVCAGEQSRRLAPVSGRTAASYTFTFMCSKVGLE